MPKKESGLVKASGLLFLLGIIIAIIAGLFKTWIDPTTVTSVLVILGFIIGLLGAVGQGSIDKNEAQMFLLAVVALIAAGSAGAVLGNIPIIGVYLSDIVGYIAALVMPAAVIIALEAIWRAGSTKF
jgi:membrane protease YdiL (CAAX protease family)